MDARDLTNAVFVIWVILLGVGTFTTIGRLLYKKVNHLQLPKLLVRDAIMVGGLTLPFLLIFAARAADGSIREGLKDNLIWIMITSLPALIAMAVYDYFEIFVIGPPTKDSEAKAPNEYKNVD